MVILNKSTDPYKLPLNGKFARVRKNMVRNLKNTLPYLCASLKEVVGLLNEDDIFDRNFVLLVKSNLVIKLITNLSYYGVKHFL